MDRIGKKASSTERRHFITFRQKTSSVPDGEGGFVDTWTDFISVFAGVYPYRADQVFNFKSVNVEATHLIKTTGHLQLPFKTKREGAPWGITWSGIGGSTVRIHYQKNGGPWVAIGLSAPNNGAYTWTIPTEAIGRGVVVRVMHATDVSKFVIDGYYLIVAAAVIDRPVNECDRIVFDGRIMEILTIEDVQERHFEKFISCKERRG